MIDVNIKSNLAPLCFVKPGGVEVLKRQMGGSFPKCLFAVIRGDRSNYLKFDDYHCLEISDDFAYRLGLDIHMLPLELVHLETKGGIKYKMTAINLRYVDEIYGYSYWGATRKLGLIFPSRLYDVNGYWYFGERYEL